MCKQHIEPSPVSHVTCHIRDGRNILYAVNLNINEGIAVDQGATSKKAAVLAAMPSDDKLAQESKKVKGTFSVSEYAPTFYSNMERVAEGVKQGKQIGEILSDLLEIVLEEPEKNKKETLLSYVKETYLTEEA